MKMSLSFKCYVNESVQEPFLTSAIRGPPLGMARLIMRLLLLQSIMLAGARSLFRYSFYKYYASFLNFWSQSGIFFQPNLCSNNAEDEIDKSQ